MKHLKVLLCMCLFSTSVFGQMTITGTVVDDFGLALPGATIIEVGTNNGVSTDFDGNFRIIVNEGVSISASSVGYQTMTIVVGQQDTIDFKLNEDNLLEEVTVTALGIKRNPKALGYSVTQVKGEELSTVKSTNAINSLQGKVAGVQISGNSAGAGGSTRVIIRGNSSLTGNNQPLYVVDGITINNTNLGSAGTWGGADSGDGISAINPDEVESVSVLKGGAAAALYGSRASNGVVIITTKSGDGSEGISVDVNSSIQIDDIRNDPFDPQTRYGQGLRYSATTDNKDNLTSWGTALNGSSVEQFDGVSRPYSYQGSNLDKFYQTGQTLINTVAVSSSSKNSNLRMSFSNLQNKDLLPNSSLDRNSLGLNGSTTLKDVTATVNLKYVYDNIVGTPRLSDSPGNANFSVRLLAPNINVYDLKGEGGEGRNADLSELQVQGSNPYQTNPYFAAYQWENNSNKARVIGSTQVRWDLTDYLYATGRFGIDRYDYKRTTVTAYGTAFSPLGGMNEHTLTNEQIDADLFIGTDALKIADDFAITAFVGVGKNHQKAESLSLNGSRFIVPFLNNVKNTENQSADYGFSERKINSAYGSFELGYSEAAYLTVTARNDWFSTLSLPGKVAPNNDLFTSASLSFVLTDLFDLPEVISFAKLRGAYSQVAGGANDPYALNLTYGIYSQGHQGSSLGQISNSSIPNSEITPFEKNETEFGLDLRLLNNRVSLDLTYYDNSTDGDIVGVSASQTSGYSSALANLGVISNKGIEALLNVRPIENDVFHWDLSFNYSKNNSEIVSTNSTDGNISLEEPRSRNIRVTHLVGEQYGALYGTSFNRDSQGTIIYDIQDDGTPIAQIGERKILGFGVAPTALGISNSFRYKNYNLNFLIEGKYGGQVYSGTNAVAKQVGLHKDTVDADGRENGHTVSGVDANGSAFTATIAPERIEDFFANNYNIAEDSVYDNDYLRLRQLSIGYRLPENLLKGTFIKNANVSIIGRNLFFINKSVVNIDPEAGYNVSNSQGLEWFGNPIPRSIGMNVNLKF